MPSIDYQRLRTFLSRLPIKNTEKRIVPFVPRPGQQMFLNLLEERQRKHQPPWLIIVKSRRVGISAICIGCLTAHCVSIENADARITAHLAETSTDLFNATALMQASLRHAGLINASEATRHIVPFSPKSYGSKITSGTAKTAAGGRGMGFSALLATEAAYYEKEESFLSLLAAGSTTPKPDFFKFIESTANGQDEIGEPFFIQWELAVARQSDYGAFFLGPQDDPECIISDNETVSEILERPSFEENEREEKYLKQRFKLNPGQLAWRRHKLGSECQGDLRKLHQEYPYYPEQAFVSSGHPCFTEEELHIAETAVDEAPRPRQMMLDATEPGYDRKITPAQRSGPFFIIKPPVAGHQYFIGADAARGEDEGDFSAAVVWDGTTDEEVALYNERSSVDVFPDHLDRLGRWYVDGNGIPAMMNIEISCNLGNTVFHRIRDVYKYPHFYRWRGKDDRQQTKRPFGSAVCWETTQRTREMLMAEFRVGLTTFQMKVQSEMLISQMKKATIKFGSRWDVRLGHDDVLMAAMIGWIARMQWPPALAGFKRVGGIEQVDKLDVPNRPALEMMRNISPLLEAHQHKVLGTKPGNVGHAKELWQHNQEQRIIRI